MPSRLYFTFAQLSLSGAPLTYLDIFLAAVGWEMPNAFARATDVPHLA